MFGIIVSSTLADPGDDPNNYAADKNADEDDVEFSSSWTKHKKAHTHAMENSCFTDSWYWQTLNRWFCP